MRDIPSIRAYFEAQVEAAVQSLRKMPDEYLLAVEPEALADHLASDRFPNPVEEDAGQPPSVESVRVDRPHFRDASRTVEVTEVILTLHLVEHPSVSVLFDLQPGTWNPSTPRYTYTHGRLQCRCRVDPAEIERSVEALRNEIKWRNEDVATFSREFRGRLVDGVRSRQAWLQRERTAFEAVAAELTTLRVVHRGFEGLAEPPVRVKEAFRRVLMPVVVGGGQAALPDEVHAAIVRLITSACAFMERAPGSFSGRSETEHRDLILAVLNSVFDGQASGEAFNKAGKTDISLRVGDGSLFVAECKLWKGPATVGEATGQLLSYLRWRDTRAMCVIFSDRADFSNVLASHRAAVAALPTTAGPVTAVTPTHLRSTHAGTADVGGRHGVDHLIVDLSTRPPGGRA